MGKSGKMLTGKPRPDAPLDAPTLSLPFGVGNWTDTSERYAPQLGDCPRCNRSFVHRYHWGELLMCVNCYWHERLETEWRAGREADRHDRERERERLGRVG